MKLLTTRYSLFLLLVFPWPNLLSAESLKEYAKKCDAAIGMTVPSFNCDAGTEIPLNKDPITGKCDEPARLNSACNVGNRFTVLKPKINEDQDAYAVAHCRKKASGYYDIAVI